MEKDPDEIVMDRSEAARRGWVTRRRRLARAAGAPVIVGVPVYTNVPYFSNQCATCGRDLFAEEMIKLFVGPSAVFRNRSWVEGAGDYR